MYNQNTKKHMCNSERGEIMASSVMQIRVDEQLRNEATELYERLGIDLPTAVRMFMKRSVMVNGIPFSMTLPKKEDSSAKAIMAMREVQDSAEKNGLSGMTLDEINAEIACTRDEMGAKGR